MRVYIAGRRGAGKTTAAWILQEWFGADVVRITDPIYEIARAYFGMEGKDRLLLQKLGDAFRAVDPAWLAKHAARTLEGRAVPDRMLVIEGVRTPEEAVWLNANGWTGVLVTAPDSVRLVRRSGEPEEVDRHHTETAVDSLPVALHIRNDGTPDDLTRTLVVALAAVGIMAERMTAGEHL